MKRFWVITIAMCVCMGVFLCGCSGSSGSETSVSKTKYQSAFSISVEKAGTVSEYLQSIHENGDGTFSLLNPFNENTLGVNFDNIIFWEFGDNGYYLVYDYDNPPNYVGLVSEDLEVLIPCEAAIISEVSSSGRYLEVVYATEQTANREDAYLFAHPKEYMESGIEIPGMPIEPDPTDPLFTGYSVYYDLQERRFVPNIKKDITAGSVLQVGDNLYLYENWSRQLYSPRGETIDFFTDVNEKGDFFTKYLEGENYEIYDADLNFITSVPFRPNKICDDNASLFLTSVDPGDYEAGVKLVDRQGNEISDLRFANSLEMHGDLMYGHEYGHDDYYAVIKKDGEKIIDFQDGVEHVDRLKNDYLKVEFEDSTYGLVYPNGDLVRIGDDDAEVDDFIYAQETKNGYKVFVLQDQGFTLNIDNAESLDGITEYLIEVRNKETDLCDLYSVLDGRKILEGYKGFNASVERSKYIYGTTEEGVDVFRYKETVNGEDAGDEGETEIPSSTDAYPIVSAKNPPIIDNDTSVIWNTLKLRPTESMPRHQEITATFVMTTQKAFDDADIDVEVDKETGFIRFDSNILFERGSDQIMEQGKSELDRFLSIYMPIMKDQIEAGNIGSIVIEGHTDTDGSHEYNQDLSERRADTVAAYVISSYPDFEPYIEKAGYSYDRPILAEDGTIDMAASRRVVFSFIIAGE